MSKIGREYSSEYDPDYLTCPYCDQGLARMDLPAREAHVNGECPQHPLNVLARSRAARKRVPLSAKLGEWIAVAMLIFILLALLAGIKWLWLWIF